MECKIKKSGDERLPSTTTGLGPSLSKAPEIAPSKEAFNASTDSLKLSFLACLTVLLDFRCRRETNKQATVAMACFDDLREARHRVKDVCGTTSRSATQKKPVRHNSI